MPYEDHKRESEEVGLPVKRYRIDGLLVCASWYADDEHANELCQFLGSRKFGCVKVCMWTGGDIHDRYPGKAHYFTPRHNCPIWDYEKEVQPLIDRLRIQMSSSK
jgi:hypothetical protein